MPQRSVAAKGLGLSASEFRLPDMQRSDSLVAPALANSGKRL